MAMATVLDPHTKLEEFKVWDDEEPEKEWASKYRRRFLDEYLNKYCPKGSTKVSTPSPLNARDRRRDMVLQRRLRNTETSEPSQSKFQPPSLLRQVSESGLALNEATQAKSMVEMYVDSPAEEAPSGSGTDREKSHFHTLFSEKDNALTWWKGTAMIPTVAPL
jgi:hypothetical protein